MKLPEIFPIAEESLAVLSPFCERIEIGGSIRRRCTDCHDIELILIPRTRDLLPFVRAVDRWISVKGKATERYTQRRHPSGVLLDLFMATPENWGVIFAIRTGSSRFSHEVLARGWVRAGYHSQGGMLRRGERPIPVPEEQDLFALIGIPWVEPEERNR